MTPPTLPPSAVAQIGALTLADIFAHLAAVLHFLDPDAGKGPERAADLKAAFDRGDRAYLLAWDACEPPHPMGSRITARTYLALLPAAP